MKTQIDYNGKIFTSEENIFKSSNRGFRFGDAIFETIFVDTDSIRLYDYHWDRLKSGCEELEFLIPEAWNQKYFQDKIAYLLKINALSSARVRLTVFRGDSSFGEADLPAEYLIEIFPLENYNTRGVNLGLYTAIRKSPGILSNYKTANYLLNVLAKLYASKNEFDDCLYLNDDGRICESSISNVFWIEKGKIYTPPLTEGPVAGVMRRHLIKELEYSENPVIEKELHVEKLYDAEEIFLTNAIRGIIPVKSFSGKIYKTAVTNSLMLELGFSK